MSELRNRQSEAWVKNEPLLVEALVAGIVPSLRDSEVLELIYAEVLLRIENGDSCSAEDYHNRFPKLTDELQRIFLLHNGLGNVGDDLTVSKAQGLSPHNTGRFHKLRSHLKGGIGEIFVAFDAELNREVAVKELQREYSQNESSRSRFIREARITGELEHPGIVPVYSLAHDCDNRPYYAMQLVRGVSLQCAIEVFHKGRTAASTSQGLISDDLAASVLDEIDAEVDHRRSRFTTLAFRKLLRRFIDVCHAIEYAHSRGVLHRDLKPQNIMLGPYRETLVVDWGLAKKFRQTAPTESSRPLQIVQVSVDTIAGAILGTPAYMPPEQASGQLKEVGTAADIYSLGATLYHLLTGVPPFQAPLPEVLAHVQAGVFPRPQTLDSQIPRALEAICLKAMALDYTMRFESCSAIAEDLENWLADEPVSCYVEGIVGWAGRWLKKHRAWALSGIAALVAITLVTAMASLWINEQRIVNGKLASDMTALAEKERNARGRAELSADEAATHRYAVHMQIAQLAWDSNDLLELARVLSLHDPKSETFIDHADLRGPEWYYLSCPQHYQLCTLQPQRHKIQRAAYSPDGKYVAGCGGGIVTVWDSTTWRTVADFEYKVPQRPHEPHYEYERALALNSAGDAVVVVESGVVYCWAIALRRMLFEIDIRANHISSIAFSDDGMEFRAAATESVRRWSLVSGEELEPTFDFNLNSRRDDLSLNRDERAYSPDGRLTASGSGSTVIVKDATTMKIIRVLSGGHHEIGAVLFGPNSDRLAAACSGGVLLEWKLDHLEWFNCNCQPSRIFRGNSGAQSLCYSPDGTQLIGVIPNGIGVWSTPNWRASSFNSFSAVSSDDGAVRSLLESGNISQYDPRSRSRSSTAFSEWDPRPFPTSPYKGPRTVSGTGLAACCIQDDVICVVDLVANTPALRLQADGPVSDLEFAPDGRLIVAVTERGTVHRWDTREGSPLPDISVNEDVHHVQCSPDCGRIIVGTRHRGRIFDMKTGALQVELRKSIHLLFGHAAFNSDGTLLATTNAFSMEVQIWDAWTGRLLRKVQGGVKLVSYLEFVSSLDRVVTASDEGIVFWDSQTGIKLFTIEGIDTQYGIKFDRSGRCLFFVGRDGEVTAIDTR